MSLDHLTALVAAVAMLVVLGACDAGAEASLSTEALDTAGDSGVQTASSDGVVADPADDPTYPDRLALALELFELSSSPEFSEQLIESLILNTVSTINMNHEALSEAEQEEVEAITREQFAEAQDRVIRRIASVYADLFLKEELEELVAFHSTETGAKFRALASELDSAVRNELTDLVYEMERVVLSQIRPDIREDIADTPDITSDTTPDLDE